MKKIILLFAAISFVVMTYGQGGFTMGVKGGYGYTMLLDQNWQTDFGLKYYPSFDWNAGVSFGYNWTYYNFGFTTGVYLKNYRQRIDEKIPGSVLPMIDVFRVQYLEVPILYRLRPSGSSLTRTFTLGGPYFEIGVVGQSLLSATREHTDTLLVNSYPPADISNKFESFNFGGMIGAGFHQFGTEHVSVTHGVRINYNILKVVKGNAFLLERGYAERKQTNFFQVGYLLTIVYKFSDKAGNYGK